MNVVEYKGVTAQIIDALDTSNKIDRIELTEAEMREFLNHAQFKDATGIDLTGEITNIEPAPQKGPQLPRALRFRGVRIVLIGD